MKTRRCEVCHSPVKPLFTDITPWADHIGEDFYSHCCHDRGMGSSATTTATFCATLVDEWVNNGVKHAVICPGSRSTPMAIALANRAELKLHIFHDERSAAFAALGIGKASDSPAILLCTSGTAAVEFHAAVVEADYSQVPILVCTADRPAELQNVGAPQTINQQNLYGESVRRFVNASVAEDREKNIWRTIARDTWQASMGANLDGSLGPVHINLQFREPLVGKPGELPKELKSPAEQLSRKKSLERNRRTISLFKRIKFARLVKKRRILIIAGEGLDDPTELLRVASELRCPVLADPRSGTRVDGNQIVISAMDSMLRDERFAKTQRPEVVLRFGAPLVSKVVNSWLASCGAPQIVVTSSPVLIDPEQITKLHLVCEISAISKLISRKLRNNLDKSWLKSWADAETKAQQAINSALADEIAISEPAIARATYQLLPDNSNLFVSSSMPIRDVEWFAAPRSGLQVYANRGVNGIDGVVSTAVGVALASDLPTFLLIGDLAFLHDSNGLINLVSRNIDLRIVLIDNCGGGIFSFLPQATALETSKFEKIFGTPHNTDLALIARAHGLETTNVTTIDQLSEALLIRGPRLIRVVTDRSENVRVHERINQMVSVAIRNT